jgi:Tat protein secretion system quality control protein TatD with DNase activity
MVIDCHYHHDRLARAVGGGSADPLEFLCNLAGRAPTDAQVEVVGAVAVYCDPSTYPPVGAITEHRQEDVLTVVGIHPKKVAEFGPSARSQMFGLWGSGQLAGYGEMGLDRTAPISEWIQQEELLLELLKTAPSHGVLVIHARGGPWDPFDEEPLRRILHLFRVANVGYHREVQLHCFGGSPELVGLWVRDFPNTYFSFTLKVEAFAPAQRAGLIAVPANRLLIESDAPYFPPLGGRVGAPHLLYRTLGAIARVRGTTVNELAREVRANSLRLFN